MDEIRCRRPHPWPAGDHRGLFPDLKLSLPLVPTTTRIKKQYIDGVVISGGEPLIHPEIVDFCRKLKQKGFLVKIYTNGSRPEILKRLIDERLIDKVSMDIKASFEKYNEVAGVEVDKFTILKSIEFIMNSGINYSFNTTAIPGIVDKEEIDKISKTIKGAKKYNINNFLSDKNCPLHVLLLENKYKIEDVEALAGIVVLYLLSSTPVEVFCKIRDFNCSGFCVFFCSGVLYGALILILYFLMSMIIYYKFIFVQASTFLASGILLCPVFVIQ